MVKISKMWYANSVLTSDYSAGALKYGPLNDRIKSAKDDLELEKDFVKLNRVGIKKGVITARDQKNVCALFCNFGLYFFDLGWLGGLVRGGTTSRYKPGSWLLFQFLKNLEDFNRSEISTWKSGIILTINLLNSLNERSKRSFLTGSHTSKGVVILKQI